MARALSKCGDMSRRYGSIDQCALTAQRLEAAENILRASKQSSICGAPRAVAIDVGPWADAPSSRYLPRNIKPRAGAASMYASSCESTPASACLSSPRRAKNKLLRWCGRSLRLSRVLGRREIDSGHEAEERCVTHADAFLSAGIDELHSGRKVAASVRACIERVACREIANEAKMHHRRLSAARPNWRRPSP